MQKNTGGAPLYSGLYGRLLSSPSGFPLFSDDRSDFSVNNLLLFFVCLITAAYDSAYPDVLYPERIPQFVCKAKRHLCSPSCVGGFSAGWLLPGFVLRHKTPAQSHATDPAVVFLPA